MYYHKAYRWDISLIRAYLIQFYNTYIEFYPNVKEIKLKNGRTYTVDTPRKPISIKENLFDDRYWLQYYFLLRIKESKKKWNNLVIDREIKKVLELHKNIDIERIVLYYYLL